MNPQKYFQAQQSKYQELAKSSQNAATRVAGIRFASFIIAIPVFVYFINERELTMALLVTVFYLLLFIILVKKHNRLKFTRDQYKYLATINKEELLRWEGDFSTIKNGNEFSEKDHPYEEDLNILGSHSIYQMLNRTSTYPGQKLLADRLMGNKTVKDLALYQQSVKEMAQMPELMQTYQALGRHVEASRNDFAQFRSWLSHPATVTNLPGVKYWIYLLPILFLIGLAIASLFSITYYITMPIVITNLVLLYREHKYAQEVVAKTSASLVMLKSFIRHIELIESESFSTNYLKSLAGSFNHEGNQAMQEIGRIAKLLEHLQARNGMLHPLINIPFLLDFHWLSRIEVWQEKNVLHINRWFDSLAEIEVLISLAGQSFANSKWAMPEFSSILYHFDALKLAHPLIHPTKRIANDFNMHDKGEVILLTGPNMAGKSTFLRAVAVNLILAKMGSVVCANRFTLNPKMMVFTGMRVKDDLSENISSFYAELARIKLLLKMVNEGEPVIYFLDEILKGTNSADRHKGAEALMKQLSKLGVSGFVSTHDLALGELAKQMSSVRNFSFESTIENGEIKFDYTIRKGICQSFNACELMRQMGIKV